MLTWSLVTFQLLIACISVSFDGGIAWDNDELELFDLVEEINENFYTLLGVEESASVGDVRHAYRNLSRQLHPDKNKEADAEVKFRQLAAVYEVLKDASKRAKYDDILVNGLPNWRQPVYYYRHVQKMGLVEMVVILSIILTVCQFLVVWSVYFERKFEKERQFLSKKKKDKKKVKQQQAEAEENDLLKVELEKIDKPKLSDLLPCLTIRLLVHAVRSFPSLLKLAAEKLKASLKPSSVEEDADDEEDDGSAYEKVPRQKKKKVNFSETLPSAYEIPKASVQKQESGGAEGGIELSLETKTTKISKEAGEWTDSEVDLLRKAIIKFPGGTTERWEKIALMVGRTVKEVTSKSKEFKQTPSCSIDPSRQGITLSHLMNSTPTRFTLPDDLSRRETGWNTPNEEVVVRRRPHAATKTADRTLMIASSQPHQEDSVADDHLLPEAVKDPQQWTQSQQRLLESALIQFPKGSADRWDRVAELVAGKTKDECIKRCKYLSEVVKQKQSVSHPSSNTVAAPTS